MVSCTGGNCEQGGTCEEKVRMITDTKFQCLNWPETEDCSDFLDMAHLPSLYCKT